MPKIYLSPSFQQNVGVGNYGTEEKRCNEIANIVESELKKNNQFVVVRNNPDMTLEQVIADSNKSRADIHFSIHSNAGPSDVRGCEVYAYAKGIEADKLAQIVYKRLSAITPTADRGVKYNSLAETRQTKAIAVLIEVAFHSNIDDANWIMNNTELIGKELAKALYEYYKIDYENNMIGPEQPEEVPKPSIKFEKRDVRIGEYQKLVNEIYKAKLVVDDWWGVRTAEATKRYVALKNGSTGRLVRWYQARLKELGYDLGNTGNAGIDGDFRSICENATKDFQRKYGLDVDGVVGIQVVTKLVELM